MKKLDAEALVNLMARTRQTAEALRTAERSGASERKLRAAGNRNLRAMRSLLHAVGGRRRSS